MDDDKLWVIGCVTLLGGLSFFFPDVDNGLVQNIITGMFGLAVGRGLK